jgi:hypothetical protein
VHVQLAHKGQLLAATFHVALVRIRELTTPAIAVAALQHGNFASSPQAMSCFCVCGAPNDGAIRACASYCHQRMRGLLQPSMRTALQNIVLGILAQHVPTNVCHFNAPEQIAIVDAAPALTCLHFLGLPRSWVQFEPGMMYVLLPVTAQQRPSSLLNSPAKVRAANLQVQD